MFQKSLIRLVFILTLLLGLSSIIYAQGGPLSYGTTLNDTLNPGSPIIYTFSGNADDVVTVYVIGGNDLQATLSVSNSSGQPLGFSNDDTLTPMTNDVRVTTKLPANDTYIVTVNNLGETAGDFFLSLSVADPTTPASFTDRATVTIEPDGTAQSFSIAPNPDISQVVSIQALTSAGFSAQLQTEDGQLLASIPGGLDGTTFVLPASDTGYVLVVNAIDPTLGTQVELAILAGGALPPASTEEAQVPADPNVCTVTGNGVNVRQGPDTIYDTIGSLNEGSQFIATGQNNGWYNGTYNGQSAWVAASVVNAVGNCDLPLVDAPPAPSTPSESSEATSTTAVEATPTATTSTTTTEVTSTATATTASSTSTSTPTATLTTQPFTVISLTCRYFQNDGATVDFHVEGAPSTTFQIDVRQGSTTYSATRTMNQEGFLNANQRFGQAGNPNYTAYIVYNGVDQASAEC